MKPKAASEHEEGLLEYLEDIIGTSGYKEPIEEALAAMETYNEERGEKVILPLIPTTSVVLPIMDSSIAFGLLKKRKTDWRRVRKRQKTGYV
jgi:hypothetical protein